MARKFIDCREYPSENHCTIAISADGEDELRSMLREAIKEGSPA
jgi:hypothetical protein